MKLPAFDRDLARTVLFSVAVVLFVVGVYQTLLQNDLLGNYWLFMLSIVCLLLYRRLKLPEPAAPPATAPKSPPSGKAAGKARKRR
jgi:hypothetical protein